MPDDLAPFPLLDPSLPDRLSPPSSHPAHPRPPASGVAALAALALAACGGGGGGAASPAGGAGSAGTAGSSAVNAAGGAGSGAVGSAGAGSSNGSAGTGSGTGSGTGPAGGSVTPPGGAGTRPGGSAVSPPDLPASAADASRFLQQASLGATVADLATLQSQGYSAWLTQQLAITSTQTSHDWLIAHNANVPANMFDSTASDAAAWRALIGERNPVVQRLTLFWSEFFVVSVNGLDIPWPQFAAATYYDLLAAHATGNFRDLLKAVTLSPAMGWYLSLQGSQKANAATNRHPDENYAREVMQLFTLGLYELNADGSRVLSNGQPVPTYGQADVTGMAAALTGWNFTGTITTIAYLSQPMVQVASYHTTDAISFLGVTIAPGTTGEQALEILLDTLFNHRNVAPFVAKQMIQRLVTSNPSPAYVARVSAVFANDGHGVRGNLAAVFKAVLLDSEARTAGAAGQGRVREPMLRLVQWARTFGATSAGAWSIGDTSDPARALGQSPLRSPSVFNFFAPDYTPPATPLASQGLVAPELQLLDETSVSGYLNYMQHVIASGAGDVTCAYATELTLASNATALVQHIDLMLAANQLSGTVLAQITAAITAMPAATPANLLARVHAAVLLVMASPSYQVLK